jgi:hypothetical protein
METIRSPKRQFELVLHSTKSHKTPLIDTAVKASQKTEVFQYILRWYSKQTALSLRPKGSSEWSAALLS